MSGSVFGYGNHVTDMWTSWFVCHGGVDHVSYRLVVQLKKSLHACFGGMVMNEATLGCSQAKNLANKF